MAEILSQICLFFFFFLFGTCFQSCSFEPVCKQLRLLLLAGWKQLSSAVHSLATMVPSELLGGKIGAL